MRLVIAGVIIILVLTMVLLGYADAALAPTASIANGVHEMQYGSELYAQLDPAAPGAVAPTFDEDTTAVVQVGRWLDLAGQVVLMVMGIAVTYISTYIPGFLRPFFNNIRVDKLYSNAVYAMIAKAKEAGDIQPDGTVTVDLKNKYLDDVVEYVSVNADAALQAWIGDPVIKAKAYIEKVLASSDNNFKISNTVKVVKELKK